MTNPLTTPSGVEQSIPIPRNADGSPMTKAQARIIRARTVQKQILAGQAGAVAEATSDEARFKVNEPWPTGNATGEQTVKLPYDATGPLSLEEAQARLDAEDDFNEKAEALRKADADIVERRRASAATQAGDPNASGVAADGSPIETGPAFPDDPTLQKALEDADLKVDYKRVDVPEPLKQTDESLSVQTDAQVVSATPHELSLPEDFEQPKQTGVFTDPSSDPVIAEAVENYEDAKAAGETPAFIKNGGEPQESLPAPHVPQVITPDGESTPRAENPRQPAKKTPAQKRAETIAAKKAAEEAAIAAQAQGNA